MESEVVRWPRPQIYMQVAHLACQVSVLCTINHAEVGQPPTSSMTKFLAIGPKRPGCYFNWSQIIRDLTCISQAKQPRDGTAEKRWSEKRARLGT